ncbi:helix-turn-helix domain-containing protein [Bosea rubneri]|uniref:AraC family transcriptional regulator n=1 Tax=Bosea rubneri TaxID=3075434 RepID=A0ABU3S577_9HYPH|nr:AraC family transcriptional regulator [Bosea sp. ZW T0_25]MDU0339525.1 AraC family transcriptional regulator [Bosea sp. ZW T0_25]
MSIHLEIRSYRGADRHSHDYSQILLPMQGAMRLDVEGHRSVVSRNCVAVIPRDHQHDFEPSVDCSMLILDVETDAFVGEAAPAVLRDPVPSLTRVEPWLWRMFRQLGAEVEAGACRASDAAGLALAGLQLIEPQALPRPLSRAEGRVLDVAGASRPGSVSEMARAAGLGQSRFHELFRATTGQSPKQSQLSRLFDEAADRLVTTSLPICEIAYAIGYQNASSFNRQFRRRFGLTPSEFRAASRG